jgi:hypothetical protein
MQFPKDVRISVSFGLVGLMEALCEYAYKACLVVVDYQGNVRPFWGKEILAKLSLV